MQNRNNIFLQKIIDWGIANSKKVFFLDGVGALLSAFLLGCVLVEFEPYFGIPVPTLYFLALLPCLFAVYDVYCYFSKYCSDSVLLKGIAFMNSFYCFLSLALLVYHFNEVKFLGWGYILLEIIVVLSIATIEYKVAISIQAKSQP